MTSAVDTPRDTAREGRKRPVVAGVRLTPAEMHRLRARAEHEGMSVSEFLHGLVERATA
jgi:hypothetical protein